MGQTENAVLTYIHYHGFPGASVMKNLPAMQEAHEGDMDLIPESGGSPGGAGGNPPQYSCL